MSASRTLDLQGELRKIEDQAVLATRGLEVSLEDGEVNRLDVLNGFEFDHDEFLHEQVESMRPDFHVPVHDGDLSLRFDFEAHTPQLNYQRFLVDRFEKARTQFTMDYNRGRDNLPGKLFVFHGVLLLLDSWFPR